MAPSKFNNRSNHEQPEFGCIGQHGVERASVSGPWAWDVRLNQLSGGKFYSKLQYVSTPEVMLYEQNWRRKVEVQGFAPKGCVMLGVNICEPGSNIEWCGESLDQRRFSCATSGAAIDFKTPERNRHMVLLMKTKALENALGYEKAVQFEGRSVFDFTPSRSRRLIATMKSIIQAFSNVGEQGENLISSNSINALLFESLGHCLDNSNLNGQFGPTFSWKLNVRNALLFVESRHESVTALELAVATGVSQRTLEYAFRDQLGMTPAAYLRLHRLNAAHRELSEADPGMSTVTRIALNWGFNHPGRFSLAHRKLFGENPAEVLRRMAG